MDASVMVVVPSPAASETNSASINSGATGKTGAQGKDFNQVLDQSLVNQSTSRPSKQLGANILNGAGQLDHLLRQLFGQVTKADNSVKETSKDQAKEGQQQKLTLPADLAAVIMQLMQQAGLSLNDKSEDVMGKGTVDLEKIIAQFNNSSDTKGQIAVTLQKALNESQSLEQMVGKLEQMIVKLSEQNAGKDSKNVNSEAKNLLAFLTELKKVVQQSVDSNGHNIKGNPSQKNPGPDSENKEIAKDNYTKISTSVHEQQQNITKPTETNDNKNNDNLKKISIETDSAAGKNQDPQNNIYQVSTVNAGQQNSEIPKENQNINKYNETIFNQVVKKAEVAIKDGQSSEMKIQLHPDFLGKVEMQIKIEAGVVTAKFTAENAQVKQLIEANLSSLKQNLTDQGLKVDQLLVTVGQEKDFNSFQQRRGQPEANGKQKIRSKVSEDILDSDDIIVSSIERNINNTYGYSESAVNYVI